jgi:hypothetical protein
MVYQYFFVGLEQADLYFNVTISIPLSVNGSTSIVINKMTATSSCVSCDLQFTVAANVTQINADGTTFTGGSYNISDPMYFLLKISDPGLSSVYYI